MIYAVGVLFRSGQNVVGRFYFVRQAATLLKFASATTNPQVAAALVEKAADLKQKIEQASPAQSDMSPAAPDVESS